MALILAREAASRHPGVGAALDAQRSLSPLWRSFRQADQYVQPQVLLAQNSADTLIRRSHGSGLRAEFSAVFAGRILPVVATVAFSEVRCEEAGSSGAVS